MHVLVYEPVLRDDVEFQLAHADWIVQVPDLRWCSNSDTDPHANTYADSNSDTNAYADTNSDACAVAECANEFSCESGIYDAGKLVVDG